MVPPPKRIDAVEVRNTTDKTLTFRVAYNNHKDNTEILEEQTVQPGGSHTFNEKELDMGDWKAIAPVLRVHVEGPGGSHHTLEPAVGGLVKLLRVEAGEGAAGLLLAQQH